jgi:hypothetical protein
VVVATVCGLLGAGSGWLATLLAVVRGAEDTEPVTSVEGRVVLPVLVSNGFSTSKRPEFEQPAAEIAKSVRTAARGQNPERTTSHARIWLLTHTHKSWSLNKHCGGK